MEYARKHICGKQVAESWPSIYHLLKAPHSAARLTACGFHFFGVDKVTLEKA
jgi:hypothetical protein